MRLVPILFALAGLAGVGAALANDSTAEQAAGGLVLLQNRDIDILSEDLFVSAEQVRVRYVFRNRSTRDVNVIVAFPMPARDFSELRHSDASFPRDFTTLVDGRPVQLEVERKAMLEGTDHSALLQRLGVPILAPNIVQAVDQAVARLAPEQRRQLRSLGLVDAAEYDVGRGMQVHYEPMWTLRETWHWRQTFPAGRNLVVEHRYAPGVGMSVGSPLTDRGFRDSPESRNYMARYCIDRAFLAGIDRMSARSTPQRPVLIGERRISYILTTGSNWRSPIGDFRLVVDKGRPDNLVSFCGSGLRRLSPTRFEMRRRNWRPDRDLDVLIVTPQRAD